MSGEECHYDGWANGQAFCTCGSVFDSVQQFERHAGLTIPSPTPVPSGVAETTAGEREADHPLSPSCSIRSCGQTITPAEPDTGEVEALIGLIEARAELREVYRVWSERRQNLSDLTRRLDENARQIADALTPALFDRVRREEGERIAQALLAHAIAEGTASTAATAQ